MQQNLDLRNENMIDCLGLIDLHFQKNPDEDKDLFVKNDEAMQGFLNNLVEHPSVVKAFPEYVNFLFNDLKYTDVMSKISFEEFNVITNEEAGWILVRVKRQNTNA